MARSGRVVFRSYEGGDAGHMGVLVIAITLYTPKQVRLLFFEGRRLGIGGIATRLRASGKLSPRVTPRVSVIRSSMKYW